MPHKPDMDPPQFVDTILHDAIAQGASDVYWIPLHENMDIRFRIGGLQKNAVKIPVIGIGGIMNCEDVLEFLITGATAVQVGTANFINPHIAEQLVDDLEDYCKQNNISDVNQVIGSLVLK